MEKSKLSILVVDDDKQICKAISRLLEIEGYNTFLSYNGKEAIKTLSEEKIDLIIIDIMMPVLDGLSTIVKLRENNNIPVIIISAKTQGSDKVLGLSMGADDYISKPYNPQELVARVNSSIRRYYKLGDFTNKNSDIVNGRIVLKTESKSILVDGEIITLTSTEYKILEFLMKNIGRVFSSETIYENIWNESGYNVENTVMVHIRRIREKIEINPSKPEYLKVVWGIGYKIEKVK